MTPKVGIAAVVALGILLVGSMGEDVLEPASAAPIQEGWPVPGPDARAQFALTLETTEPVRLGPTTFQRARCVSWLTVRTVAGADGLDLVRTQGRVRGSLEPEEEGRPRETRPFGCAIDFHALLFGEGGVLGRTVRRSVEGGTARKGEAQAAWTVLGVVPPPPAAVELAAGLTWTADAAWPLFPAKVQPGRFVIEAVEAETIRVHATWPGADLAPGWLAPDADLVVDVSRRDGLALSASIAMTFTSTEAAPDVDGIVRVPVEGTLERLRWTEPPAPGPDVEALAKDLAAPDPLTRAKAAKRLGAAWPDAGRVATALVAAREDEDARVRRVAGDALRHLVERGVPSILAFLDEPLEADREGYESAMVEILRLGAKLTPRDLAAAAITCPPCAAIGLLALHPFGKDVARIEDAVWMLEGMAGSPAVLGPTGYEVRNRELGTAVAAFVGLEGLPQDVGRAPPPGVLDRLRSERFGTKAAAMVMLARWGGATPEVVEALRGCLGDEDELAAYGARFALDRLGHPAEEGTTQTADDLMRRLERFDADALGSRLAYTAVDVIDALLALGADAVPAVEALEALATRARDVSGPVYERAVAALVQLAGPTRERRAALIEALERQLGGRDLEPWRSEPLLSALTVEADRMDEDQAREVVRLVQSYEDGKAFLNFSGLRRLLLAIDARHQGPLETVWIGQLAKVPPHTADLFPSVPEARRGRVIPGTERFHTAVELGAKVFGTLGLRRDLIDAAGRYRGSDERVRGALERLVADGDVWTRTVAARAIRHLDVR